MNLLRTVHPPEVAGEAEPTLGTLLTHYARTAVPSRIYKLLQFGIPFALDFGLHGYLRAAAWGVAISSLGAWGLADRWLFNAAARADRRARLMRVARAMTGAVAASIAALLLIEIFLHMLGSSPIS
jgi:hypothetical protein